jgi:hypothetical protein
MNSEREWSRRTVLSAVAGAGTLTIAGVDTALAQNDGSDAIDEYANLDGTVSVSGLTDAMNDWSNESINSTALQTAIDALRSGDVVATPMSISSETLSYTVGPEETASAGFTVTNESQSGETLTCGLTTNGDGWSLTHSDVPSSPGDPVDLNPGESVETFVQFNPTTAGDAPDGSLDVCEGRAEVSLAATVEESVDSSVSDDLVGKAGSLLDNVSNLPVQTEVEANTTPEELRDEVVNAAENYRDSGKISDETFQLIKDTADAVLDAVQDILPGSSGDSTITVLDNIKQFLDSLDDISWRKWFKTVKKSVGLVSDIMWIFEHAQVVADAYTYCLSLDEDEYAGDVWNCITERMKDQMNTDEVPAWHALKDLFIELDILESFMEWLNQDFTQNA